jgi:hypothetical protein
MEAIQLIFLYCRQFLVQVEDGEQLHRIRCSILYVLQFRNTTNDTTYFRRLPDTKDNK